MIKKQKSRAFGKDIYLLGTLEGGGNIWLEQGTWDCEWYWGFGYVETYTNNRSPHLARDIMSHQRFSGFVGLKDKDNNYIHHLNDNPEIKETVLTDGESWRLTDLMQSFYTLRKAAEIYHQGNSHLTSDHSISLKNKAAEKRINEKEIPLIMEAVYAVLTPKEGTK